MPPPAEPPKELSKSDVPRIQSQMSSEGAAGADKLSELVDNFDQHAGNDGKSSTSEFKSFASQNGISLPQPPSPSGSADSIREAAKRRGGVNVEA